MEIGERSLTRHVYLGGSNSKMLLKPWYWAILLKENSRWRREEIPGLIASLPLPPSLDIKKLMRRREISKEDQGGMTRKVGGIKEVGCLAVGVKVE